MPGYGIVIGINDTTNFEQNFKEIYQEKCKTLRYFLKYFLCSLLLQSTYRQRVVRSLINHGIALVGCTTVICTFHFSIRGNEGFYRSILMPVAMRVLDPERSHTFAVWMASKGLIPVDRTGDPEILVNINFI